MSKAVSVSSAFEGNTTFECKTSSRLSQLVCETAGFLDVESGETVPKEEVWQQGKAVGYSRGDFEDILSKAGATASTSFVVPKRDGTHLGDVWAFEKEASRVPGANSVKDTFDEWLQYKRNKKYKETSSGNKVQFRPDHSFSRKEEDRRFARAADVERFYVQNTDIYSTVWISLSADNSGETPVENASKFFPSKLKDKIRNDLKKYDLWKSAAVLRMLAPNKPPDNLPKTHGHLAIWIPGEVTPEMFHGIVEKHCEEVPGASMEDNPLDKSVSVHVHISDEVESPDYIDSSKGHTSALPHEISNNLPIYNGEMGAGMDALNCQEYIKEWCAYISAGNDGKHTTNGIRRWSPQGNFKKIADYMDGQIDDCRVPGVNSVKEDESVEKKSSDESPTVEEETHSNETPATVPGATSVKESSSEKKFAFQREDYFSEGKQSARRVPGTNSVEETPSDECPSSIEGSPSHDSTSTVPGATSVNEETTSTESRPSEKSPPAVPGGNSVNEEEDEGCPRCNSTDLLEVDVPYADEMYACCNCDKTFTRRSKGKLS
ncbi:hypothetical protein [Haladaptatus sp. R4]|uniref:hypothetical protein n=1 Tax=Haladaptatus sp. R4 TaxID=1679489 RepID=UPI000AB7E2C4|nr:hypothetical protein [Haladaptatus sp. R4]